MVVEGQDGHLYRKTYSFDSYRIHMVNRELYDPAAKTAKDNLASSPGAGLSAGQAASQSASQSDVKRSWYAMLKDRVHRFLR